MNMNDTKVLDGVDADGYVGKIMKDGKVVGRIDMGGDGKAMVFVGEAGDKRVRFASGTEATYSDDDAPLMVQALFRMMTEGVSGAAFARYMTESGGDQYEAAKNYFKDELQGNIISTVIGNVRVSGKGWQKFKSGLKNDAIKAELVGHIKDILTTGEYVGKSELHKKRADKIVAFHFFQKEDVPVASLLVTAGVTVGEDEEGNFFYNISHDNETKWLKRGGIYDSAASGFVVGSTRILPCATLDAAGDNLANDGSEVNITILAVKDMNGKPVDGMSDVEKAAFDYPTKAAEVLPSLSKDERELLGYGMGVMNDAIKAAVAEGYDLNKLTAAMAKAIEGGWKPAEAKPVAESPLAGKILRTKFYPVDIDAKIIYDEPKGREKDVAAKWPANIIGLPGSRLLDTPVYGRNYRIEPAPQPESQPAGPSEQFQSYADWINKGEEVPQGMREQIAGDTRLNDGEAEQLLALADARKPAAAVPAPSGMTARPDLEAQVSKLFNGASVTDVRVDDETGSVTATVGGKKNADAGFVEDYKLQNAAAPAENPAMTEAKTFLQSVIKGTADMMDAELAERLTAIHDQFSGDSEILALFNDAAKAYSSWMIDTAKRAMS